MKIPDPNLGEGDRWARAVMDSNSSGQSLSSQMTGEVAQRFDSIDKSLNIMVNQSAVLKGMATNLQIVQVDQGSVPSWTATTAWTSKVTLPLAVPSGTKRVSITALASAYCVENDSLGYDFRVTIAGNSNVTPGGFLTGASGNRHRSWSVAHAASLANPTAGASIIVSLDAMIRPGGAMGTFSQSGATLATITTFYR